MTYNFEIVFMGENIKGQHTCNEYIELRWHIQGNWPGAELISYEEVK
jgi:hypothetical protein